MIKGNKKKQNKFTKGFTLIELLVIVLIIGILAAVALPQYKKAVLKSKFATIKNTARVIYEAEQRYYILYDKYIKDWQNLDIDTTFKDCIVSPSSYIVCGLKDTQNNVLLQYIIMLNAGKEGKRRCDAFPGNPKSITNQICQSETGKKKSDNGSCGNFCVYYYN